MRRSIVILLLLLIQLFMGCSGDGEVVLLKGDFENLSPGMLSSGVIGAHAEYHYIDAVAPRGGWVVSDFSTNSLSQRAWRVICEDGRNVVWQAFTNDRKYFHPMVVAGDSLWQDYTLTVSFVPDSLNGLTGAVFRYQNDRCYYFAGVDGDRALLKTVNHATGFHQPTEQILDDGSIRWDTGKPITMTITVTGSQIRVVLRGGPVLEAEDDTFAMGKIGLTSDVPARFLSARVVTGRQEYRRYRAQRERREKEVADLQARNPKPVLWKKISTPEFGVGRNLRFGDLNNDGRTDVLVTQVKSHGPKDSNSEVGTMTAMTFDGDILWQRGEPDRWNDQLTNDVGVQIHDLDGDGRTEVVYCKDFKIVVADGATGKTKYSVPTPVNQNTTGRFAKYPRILGDCLYFADFRGTGRDADLVIKDRYSHFWVYNDQLELEWSGDCTTGHYPFATDVDGDGKDELAIGYSLYDDDGRLLWSLDDRLHDHSDGVAVVDFTGQGGPLRMLNAASDEGIFFADLQGNILRHHYIGHVQNPAIANFRDDLPGLEAVSVNFWGNQGIITFYTADGVPYKQFKPVQHGSMMLPVNWTGRSEEYFVLSADVETGGLFDGWGRKVVRFPADGHPELANAVLDLTGDARDEIVVWDPWEIWVYTQDDNSLEGRRLYRPVRNPLYNYSNYQASVSLPGWED